MTNRERIVIRMVAGVIAVGFALLYLGLYPVLTGGFVIYVYPHWPRAVAATYVFAGILVQGWFCFWPAERLTWRQLVAQAGVGALYGAAILPFSGGLYMS